MRSKPTKECRRTIKKETASLISKLAKGAIEKVYHYESNNVYTNQCGCKPKDNH